MVPWCRSPSYAWGPSRDEVIEGWPWLDQVVLDGAVIADLELELAEGVNRQELVLVPDRGRMGGPPQLEA
jgi:hypothetical protein